MGNRTRISEGGTGIRQGSADTIPAPGQPPPGEHVNGRSPRHPDQDQDLDLDAWIQRLVDSAPPLTVEQRDTLALLLRRPWRR